MTAMMRIFKRKTVFTNKTFLQKNHFQQTQMFSSKKNLNKNIISPEKKNFMRKKYKVSQPTHYPLN